MDRRDFLRLSPALLLPMLPMLPVLPGCSHDAGWPSGMAPIVWDRDICVRCRMVISDRRFAAELRGGPDDMAFRFDDIGCAVFWLRDQRKAYSWLADDAVRFWVADIASQAGRVDWLDARRARYVTGRTSPMGYGMGATLAADAAGTLDFAAMQAAILAKGK